MDELLAFRLGTKRGGGGGSGGGGSSGDVVLPQQEYAFGQGDGVYVSLLPVPGISLTAGNTYFVKWDNDPVYELTALGVGDAVGMGNLALYGMGEDNGIPFVMGTDSTGATMIITASTEASHMVGVYGDMADEPVGVETTLNLDDVSFDGNGMAEVIPDAGTLFSKIALVAAQSGGGGGITFASGSFMGTGVEKTIEHGLGVVPDFVIVSVCSGVAPSTLTQHYLYQGFGCSKALYNVTKIPVFRVMKNTGGTVSSAVGKNWIDLTSTGGIIYNATTDSFCVGDLSVMPYPDTEYSWLAFGGLT